MRKEDVDLHAEYLIEKIREGLLLQGIMNVKFNYDSIWNAMRSAVNIEHLASNVRKVIRSDNPYLRSNNPHFIEKHKKA